MSAATPLPSSETVADKRAYEPSMEEILASIRRIIADDQSLPVRSPSREADPTPAAAPIRRDMPGSIPPHALADSREATPLPAASPPRDRASAPAEPNLPVDSGMSHGSIAAPQFAMPDGVTGDDERRQRAQARVAFHNRAAREAAPVEDAVAARDESADLADPDAPAESEAAEAVYDRPIPATSPVEKSPLFSAATDSAVSAAFNMLAASRLADNSDELMTLAREMIRPLLRSWIDDNLPGMVERMVRAEIERVARGGR